MKGWNLPLLIMNLEDCVMLLSLRIQSKKQKEIRKQFQSFGSTDKYSFKAEDYPEDAGIRFLRNEGMRLSNYKISHPEARDINT
jgi:hypothetical protein